MSTDDLYHCHFYHREEKTNYSEVQMHFLPRVGDIINNSGSVEQVLCVEYGFGSVEHCPSCYNIYTKFLGHASEHSEIISEILNQKHG